jgi:hypothetical protein
VRSDKGRAPQLDFGDSVLLNNEPKNMTEHAERETEPSNAEFDSSFVQGIERGAPLE